MQLLSNQQEAVEEKDLVLLELTEVLGEVQEKCLDQEVLVTYHL